MSKKSQYVKEKPIQLFQVGQEFKIINYATGKSCFLSIKDRRGKWLVVDIDGKQREVRVNPVSNPLSESILLDDYSPLFSYQVSKKEKEEV